MNEPNTHPNPSSLEAKVASELSVLLEGASDESALRVEPSADLLYLLELYIPQVLARRHPEWERESLDGFLLANAKKIGAEAAEFAGLCILISDQTVTPFSVHLVLTPSHDLIASYRVFLGEPGGGHLGISGPPCNSPRAHRLLETIGARINDIRWSYTVTNDPG